MLHCRLRMLLRATLLACSVLGFVACRLLLFILLSVAAETLDPSKDFTYHHLRSPLPSHHSFPSLFLHFTFLWAIEQQQQLQKRELLLASVSLSTSTLASPS